LGFISFEVAVMPVFRIRPAVKKDLKDILDSYTEWKVAGYNLNGIQNIEKGLGWEFEPRTYLAV
jgi:hypothetical protein